MQGWPSARLRWGLLLGGALAWRLLWFVGPQASDDLAYSEYAQALATGAYHPVADIFSTRLGYLASIALGYRLFGAGPFTLILPNLLFSLAGIVLAYALAREFLDERGAWRTALLLAAAPPDVFLATEAHTDLPLAVLFSGSLLLYLRARKTDAIPGFILSGVVLGIAHLFKESAFFGFAALTAVGGKLKRNDLFVLAGFGAVVAAEAVGLGLGTGDPLYRFHSVRAAQAENIAALESSPGSGLGRAFLGLFELVHPFSLGFSFLGLLPLLGLAGGVAAFRSRDAALLKVLRWMLVLILLSVFWPITIVPYRPALWNHARIFMMALLPMAILTVSLIDRLPGRRALLAGAALGAAFLGFTGTLHADARRVTEGARRAFDGPLRSAGGAVADPRTAALFRLYDGYRPARQWTDWTQPFRNTPLRVVNETLARTLKEWYGIVPPPDFEPKDKAPLYRIAVPGRLRLRPLLRGKIERIAGEEVRIYEAP
ncbi:MAG: glycosyltransferase family 39 protein [Planctomycetaceae bacterium]|nr:glycosyltransferase family 39 protein [Planctomycetaceae bacterium]